MYRRISAAVVAAALLTGSIAAADYGLKEGNADLQSAGPLAFGPDGVLFVGDSKGAAIFALDTGESVKKSVAGEFKVTGVDKEIAAVLGTTAEDIMINDLAVSPAGNVYFSVSRGRGPDAEPVILKTDASGVFSELSLKNVSFAKCSCRTLRHPAERADGINDASDYGFGFCG